MTVQTKKESKWAENQILADSLNKALITETVWRQHVSLSRFTVKGHWYRGPGAELIKAKYADSYTTCLFIQL